MKDIKDRIHMIMEDQHMTQQVFAEFLQQSPATLSSIFNGRTRPTLNIVDSIKTKIPDISIEWLLYGTGDMYASAPTPSQEAPATPVQETLEPMINFDDSPSSYSPVARQPVSSPVRQQGVVHTPLERPREEVKIVNKPPRRVTEIRVYYDDQTYETFSPASGGK